MKSYTIQVSPIQVEILLETVQAFVDNQKLLHLPDLSGEIVGLPLTGKALESILALLEEKQVTDKQEVKVDVEPLDAIHSRVIVHIQDSHFEYEVNLDEFDAL